MGRLQKCIFALLIAALLLAVFPAIAEGFQTDLEGIDKAAKSVLKLEVYDERGRMIATGSGFVAFDIKTLVTNHHVMEDADYILAISDAGYQYLVSHVIAADEQRDIALLEFFSPTDMTPLTLHPGGELRRAEPVVAIGSPRGVKNTVSLGNISALYEEEGVSYILFTAPISHGSSGGALFDNQGRVIGIPSASIIVTQNMNMAVDIAEVMRLKEARWGNKRTPIGKYKAGQSAVVTPRLTETPNPTAIPETLGQGNQRVLDNVKLMSASEITGLENTIAALRKQYDMDFVVLTSNDVKPGGAREFADDFYDDNGFGTGAGYSGILFLIDMNNREFYISTAGLMIRYVTDARLNALLDAAYSYLSEGRYGDGVYAALNQLSVFLQNGIPFDRYIQDEEGNIDPYLTPAVPSALSGWAGMYFTSRPALYC